MGIAEQCQAGILRVETRGHCCETCYYLYPNCLATVEMPFRNTQRHDRLMFPISFRKGNEIRASVYTLLFLFALFSIAELIYLFPF
jgi:hypothetical protein